MQTKTFTITDQDGNAVEFECKKITLGSLYRKPSLRVLFGMDETALKRAQQRAREDGDETDFTDPADALAQQEAMPEIDTVALMGDLLAESIISPEIGDALDIDPIIATRLFSELVQWNVSGVMTQEASRFRGKSDERVDDDDRSRVDDAGRVAASVPRDNDA